MPSLAGRKYLKSLVVLTAVSLTATLAACGGSDTGSGDAGAAAAPSAAVTPLNLDAVLAKPATITYWGWIPNLDKTVALFQKKYPNVKVTLKNEGGGDTEYTKLQTVFKGGGTGIPDVVQIEYRNIANFAATGVLEDLTKYGIENYKDQFFPAAWSGASFNGKVYGVPQDFGPQVMFYRKDVFDKAGITTPPKTWAEYEEAGAKVRAADPKKYMTFADPGSGGTAESFLAQAGSKPFVSDGPEKLKVNLQDEGAKRWAGVWGSMIKKDIVEVTPAWTDEWFKAVGDGKYATWLEGAWAPTFMAGFLPQSKGAWRAAPMPTFDGGKLVTGQNASTVAVVSSSKNKEAAAAFAIWLNTDPEAVRSQATESKIFVANTLLSKDPAFLAAKDPFMGDQETNKVYVEAANAVATDWEWAPYEMYAGSVFKDTVGKAMAAKGDLNQGLLDWQARIVDYGKQQGIEVTTGS